MTYFTVYPNNTQFNALGKPIGDFPPAPEDELNEFLLLLGQTIAAWQVIECRLVILFDLAVETGNPLASSAAFHEVTGFQTRRKMVNQAIKESRLAEDGKNDWAKLSEKIRKRSLRRNELTHGVVTYDPTAKGKLNRFTIGPSPMDVNKFPKDGSPSKVNHRDLKAMKDTFIRLANELHNYQIAVNMSYQSR